MNAQDYIPQAAAVPYRFQAAGALEILLIRWAGKQKWGIPKGLVDPGHTHPQAAIIEAHEEAGVEGRLWPEPLGEYLYNKYNGLCQVRVYALQVERELNDYDECGLRLRKWFTLEQACDTVHREAVRTLIVTLGRRLDAAAVARASMENVA